MKRKLSTIKFLGVMLFLSGTAYATDPQLRGQVSRTVKEPQSFVSQAVYQSSETCGTTNVQAAWISSPMAANFYAVNITSAGTGDAKLEIYDGGNNLAVTSGRRIAYINTRAVGTYQYNVSMSSFLGINNQAIGTGALPACVQVLYSVR